MRVTLRTRLLGWTLKTIGLLGTVAGTFNALDGNLWIAGALAMFGLAMVIAGTYVSPSPGTGAFTARFMREVDNELHIVKAPGGNVLDPIDSDDSRFSGR